MKKLFLGPGPCEKGDEKTARELMVSYVAGTCSPEAKTHFETHCLNCDECRKKLVVILGVLVNLPDDEEEKVLASISALGSESARKVREMVLRA